MELMDKLQILADSAKYDVACTSSGSNRGAVHGMLGATCLPGLCHSFSADGRCVSLLKVLQTNVCAYDCQYCINRRSNDLPRAAFTPEELAGLTMEFYRRNYIEGLFLSSGVAGTPDRATEQMCRTLELLRFHHGFNGYIHAKAIPGASPELIDKLGRLSDRLSVNIELPSEKSLNALAPDKKKQAILQPMSTIRDTIVQSKAELATYRHATPFSPAGQSTQMIVGASGETDFQIMRLSESLYKNYRLKRVFFSAYIPVGNAALIPADRPTPLLREHRLYQTDWLLRFYGFSVNELLDEQHPSLDPLLDPKCQWALRHLEHFPVEINRAPKEMLLRVPGIGVRSAGRILTARRVGHLRFEDLKKLGVVLKRAAFFITCDGRMQEGVVFQPDVIYRHLTASAALHPDRLPPDPTVQQLSWFDMPSMLPQRKDVVQCLTGQL